jgi:hypothetical protein
VATGAQAARSVHHAPRGLQRCSRECAALQEVSIIDNVVTEESAGARAVSFWGGAPTPATVFADPARAVWDWANARAVSAVSAALRPNTFLLQGTFLSGLQQVRTARMHRMHRPLRESLRRTSAVACRSSVDSWPRRSRVATGARAQMRPSGGLPPGAPTSPLSWEPRLPRR